MNKKKTTVFRQLIINIVIPVVIALLILGGVNFRNTQLLIEESNQQKNAIITEQIKGIMEFQDASLNIVEENLDKRIEIISNKLVHQYFSNTDGIVDADLSVIQKELGMHPELEDIYIIDMESGVIVNTTFEKDLNLNVFSFGEGFKNFLLSILEKDSITSERFSVETSSKRIKKYTYQPTLDKKYLIETGNYSQQADNIKEIVKNRFAAITSQDPGLATVELFIGADEPFTLNGNKILEKNDPHRDILLDVFKTKTNYSLEEKVNGKTLRYEYIYMERENTRLYKSAVIRIISDRTEEINQMRMNILKVGLLFGITLLIVILLIYRKTKSITLPIKKLVENVIRINKGNYGERADVVGRNEITTLSEKFNEMIGTIESYTIGLEKKVKERTIEISKQKEEIEKQNANLSEKNDKLKHAYQEIETQKQRIEDSIVYAKRIQEAILPPVETIKEVLPNSFILFKPKEIVSGDFYWYNKQDDRVYISAVDCTGHGVPGAFMSMLGYALLNEIVNTEPNLTAGDVLFKLRAAIIKSLRQTADVGSSKDGMDMALCVVNKKEQLLEFAGANNPMYYFKQGEFEEYKGSKMPIGLYKKGNLPFTNNKFTYQQGDIFYLFSDGYVDQFGGPKKRKFMTKQFKQLLTDIQGIPMEEQKGILDATLLKWKGDLRQLDDICVIGVKL